MLVSLVLLGSVGYRWSEGVLTTPSRCAIHPSGSLEADTSPHGCAGRISKDFLLVLFDPLTPIPTVPISGPQGWAKGFYKDFTLAGRLEGQGRRDACGTLGSTTPSRFTIAPSSGGEFGSDSLAFIQTPFNPLTLIPLSPRWTRGLSPGGEFGIFCVQEGLSG